MGRVADFFKAQNISLAIQQRQQMLALDREFMEMESQIQELNSQCLKLQAQVHPLEREIERFKQQQANRDARPEPVFDAATGTYAGKEGEHYCQPCFVKQHQFVPLKNRERGWQCMVCTQFFPDPARPDLGPRSAPRDRGF